MFENIKGINTFTLKLIAILSMTIDHIGYLLFPKVTLLRIVGRIAFPIFAYLIAEGFVHTGDVKKYLLRLGIFAILSEIPYDLVISGNVLDLEQQNIFFTLFAGLLAISLVSKTKSIVLQFGSIAVIALLAEFIKVDYGSVGVMMIVLFYVFRERKTERFFIVAMLILLIPGSTALYALLSFIMIALHNKEQGPKMKWIFYLYYPVHLFILYGIYVLI